MSEELRVKESNLKPYKINPSKEPTLGLLGFPSSGKTVFAVALEHFVNDINTDKSMRIVVEEGEQYLKKIKEILLYSSEDPERLADLPTPPQTINSIKMKIIFHGESFFIRLFDMSGEIFNNIINFDEKTAKLYILTAFRSEDKKEGPLSYLLSCKAYALTIDCKDRDKWSIKQYEYNALLNRLLYALGEKKKLAKPVLLIFTKADLLPKDKQPLTYEELLEEMPEFKNFLKEHFEKIGGVVVEVEHINTRSKDEPARPRVRLINDRPQLILRQDGFIEFLEYLKKFLS